jgi:hypothetical protein
MVEIDLPDSTSKKIMTLCKNQHWKEWVGPYELSKPMRIMQ